MSPARYTAYLVIGLVAALAFVGTGIWAVASGTGVLIGWIMIVAGAAIGILSVVRLALARRS